MGRHRHGSEGRRGGSAGGSGASQQSDEYDDDFAGEAAAGTLRVDKWLWCARFFKTRGIAQAAVEGGHVQVNGDRVKASRQVHVGDRLLVVRERERYEVDILAIPARRGPAAEARGLYRETPESEAARERVREFNRLAGPMSSGRPDKRERRDLLRMLRGQGAGDSVSDSGDED